MQISSSSAEEREQIFRHRTLVYAAEYSRLRGEPTYTPEQLRQRMEDLFGSSCISQKYVAELKEEISEAKAKIAEGKQATFSSIDALFEQLEKP